MTPPVFVDTNVFVYATSTSPLHEGAVAVVEALAEGTLAAATSAAVVEELWHLELSGKVAGRAGMTEAAFTLVRPVLAVTDDIVAAALALDVSSLGANDRIHVATCHAHGITTILTADRAFDRAPRLRRVDPADLPAVLALVRRP